MSFGFGKSTTAFTGVGAGSMTGRVAAGGVYGGGAFSDSPSAAGSAFAVAAASGVGFSSVGGEGLAVYRSQIVNVMIETMLEMMRTTINVGEDEARCPARRHLAAVRRVLCVL